MVGYQRLIDSDEQPRGNGRRPALDEVDYLGESVVIARNESR